MDERPQALIRSTPEDFEVTEIPKVVPTGAGEHLMARVRKREANTPWVAERLAAWAGVPARSVSWAGLKDRHAVTEQWFSIHCLGKQPDPAAFDVPGVTLLEVHRHARKLHRGTLLGNRFRIVLRGLSGAADQVLGRIPPLRQGVPNRFGPQRFGRDGRNLDGAQRWFLGGRPPRGRSQQGFLISAARAALFNAVLDARERAGTWDHPVPGDVMMLDGRGSRFVTTAPDEAIVGRCTAGEIHPTGPLWGRGGSDATGEAALIEQAAVAPYPDLLQGLERIAQADRRPLRVVPGALEGTRVDADTVVLNFELPPGAYATTLLERLVICRTADTIGRDEDAGED